MTIEVMGPTNMKVVSNGMAPQFFMKPYHLKVTRLEVSIYPGMLATATTVTSGFSVWVEIDVTVLGREDPSKPFYFTVQKIEHRSTEEEARALSKTMVWDMLSFALLHELKETLLVDGGYVRDPEVEHPKL